MIQLQRVIIVGDAGRHRSVDFQTGKFNVITGASKTGKSSILDIVNYCLGSSECDVAYGPLRDKVAWYAVEIVWTGGSALVARRKPAGDRASSQDCYFEIRDPSAQTDYSELRKTTNVAGVLGLLAELTGLDDYVHEPQSGETRRPLAVGFRHALHLCFQAQDEIARKSQLFHGADDSFVAQSLRDTLPYLLGAVSRDDVEKRIEMRLLQSQVTKLRSQLDRTHSASGPVATDTALMLSIARASGLVEYSDDDSEGAAVQALREVRDSGVSGRPDYPEVAPGVAERLGEIFRLRKDLLTRRDRVRDEIDLLTAFATTSSGYGDELAQQASRLRSIGLITQGDEEKVCPLCNTHVATTQHIPSVASLQELLDEINAKHAQFTSGQPRMQEARARLEAEVSEITHELQATTDELARLRALERSITEFEDERTRAALVVGRIAQFLDGYQAIDDTESLQLELAKLEARLAGLTEELSGENTQQRLTSALSRVSSRMTTIARNLGLEYAESPLRLDLGKLTVVADTSQGPIPMGKMGSGENWVGYHLAAHLALHRHFVEARRPVPRFLILDQPSQVYFPEDPEAAEASISDEDRAAVGRLLLEVWEVVNELAPGFQVIVTEHANLAEDWYSDSVVEVWRGGNALVPSDWPDVRGSET